MHLRSALAGLALSALLVAGLPAQDPYGAGSPGTGGVVPTLNCNQAWMGNASFSLTVSNGLGGALALIGLSTAPGNLLAGTSQILISLTPPDPLFIWPVPLSGPLGIPGAGTGSFALPLNVPVAPALAGIDFFAQAVIGDFPTPGSPAATNALKIELAMPPNVFVGTSVGGSNDPTYLIDPLTLTLTHNFTSGADNVTDAQFANGGKNVLFGTSLGNAIRDIDTSATPPTFTTLYSPGSTCYAIGVDDDNQTVYTLASPGGIGPELVAVSYNPGAYGLPLGQTTGLYGLNVLFMERMALARDGTFAAVITAGFAGGSLILVNTDTTSIGYMTYGPAIPVPYAASAPLAIPTQVEITPDNAQVLVSVQLAGPVPGEIARYDIASGTWIDHNLSTIVVDNIGLMSLPPVAIPSAPTGLAMSRFSNFAVVSGFGGSGSAGRLDLDPTNPFFFAWTAFTPTSPLTGAWACDISGDDTTVAIGSFGGATPQVIFVDAWLGTEIGTVTIPGASNVYTVRYH